MNKGKTDQSHYTLAFEKIFHTPIEYTAHAHARANLIGEHTDYNNGCVMPVLLDNSTTVAVAQSHTQTQDTVNIYSTFDTHTHTAPLIHTRLLSEQKKQHWTDYVLGSVREIKKHIRSPLPAIHIFIDSDILSGVGISSSAALEVATIRAITSLLKIDIGELRIAKMAQRSDNEYVGVPCGLMDQMVVSMGMQHHAMYINFFNSEHPSYEFAPLFDTANFLLISSGITHAFADDEGYATRVAQCKKICSLLAINHLSELKPDDLQNISLKDELLTKRAYHVVYENKRVHDAYTALLEKDIHTFARLMDESHASQRDLYHTSLPEIDAMCNTAKEAGALGARLTGGGFGGSIIVAVEPEKKDKVLNTILTSHPKASLLASI